MALAIGLKELIEEEEMLSMGVELGKSLELLLRLVRDLLVSGWFVLLNS